MGTPLSRVKPAAEDVPITHLVRAGLEPARFEGADFESSASQFATSA